MSEPINRKVLDLSHHNTILSWADIKAAGIIGVIHKATEGTSYVDDTYENRREEATRHGLLWGAYHFATASNPVDQAEHFLATTGIHDDMLYALDWEDYGSDTMSEAAAREFMAEVDSAIGIDRCVLYSGNTAKEALSADEDAFFGQHRLWLAQYGSEPVPQPSWDAAWLWQYSDGNVGPSPQGCPGVGGDCDTNSWAETDEELKAQWSGLLRPPRPPQPRPRASVVTLIASPQTIVLVNGKLAVPVPPISRRGEK